MKKKSNEQKTISDLVPMFYHLAIQQAALEFTIYPMLEETYKEERRKIRLLKRRGIAVVEIIDKESIETYHEKEKIKENLEKFIKQNKGKWIIEEDKWGKIKTGKIILRRIYRRYNKKEKEKEYCECCGSEL